MLNGLQQHTTVTPPKNPPAQAIMDNNAGPSFTIYQDPPDQQQQQSSSTNQHIQHYRRPPLAEIRLLSWGAEAHCDSSLKHEMLIPQPEPSSSSSSPTPPDDASCVESEESKENIDSRPVDAQSFKTPPRKLLSPPLNRIAPISYNPTTTTPTSPPAPSIVPLRI